MMACPVEIRNWKYVNIKIEEENLKTHCFLAIFLVWHLFHRQMETKKKDWNLKKKKIYEKKERRIREKWSIHFLAHDVKYQLTLFNHSEYHHSNCQISFKVEKFHLIIVFFHLTFCLLLFFFTLASTTNQKKKEEKHTQKENWVAIGRNDKMSRKDCMFFFCWDAIRVDMFSQIHTIHENHDAEQMEWISNVFESLLRLYTY